MDIRDLDVPSPPDAVRVGDWEVHDGRIERRFHGTLRGTTHVPVEIVGLQDIDGSVVARMIRVGTEPRELDTAGVQELIWALADASNEIDRLAHLPSLGEHTYYVDFLPEVD